ncbi:MAG: RagB/SusD family nutrient uptake outer membrane protein [Cytophagales bacterium]|nr:RagB/SusD family nutrient uptake outer membrane protein [Bernardetiaceae bacterium]MDW8204097.1 RagB/SusD family nutrient uptake outer membrane protein [Cytophagales bacterium]
MKRAFLKTVSLSIALIVGVITACNKSFFDVEPIGQLANTQVTSQKGAEQILIGAYATLNSGNWNGSFTNWIYGSACGGDANKGSNAGDQSQMNEIIRFEGQPVNFDFNLKWVAIYNGVARANQAIIVTNNLTREQIPDADRRRIIAEARFLRGFYHFEGKKVFNMVPYIDETISYSAGNFRVPNDRDIWPNIEADFRHAYENLPEVQAQPGRANKWAAAAFLGKVLLFQRKFAEAKRLFDECIDRGRTAKGERYGLMDEFWQNFNADFDNNRESIFACQASVNDGTGAANANPDQVLNFPHNNGWAGAMPAGCCGFHQPSFDLANSFRTTQQGLPLLDGSYNLPQNELRTDMGIPSDRPFTPDEGPLDPRIDWTIGRRGIPYLDWGLHPGNAWIRDVNNGGPFSPKKNVFYRAQQGRLTDNSSWTPGFTALNYVFMRYADLLLMAAECEVELGNLERARQLVNQVRRRAANPAGFVRFSDGRPAANYRISEYTTPWSSQDFARNAVRFERRLELAMEGHRFFDLVRWGIADPVLNAYLQYESTKLAFFRGARFTRGKNEYFPIPQVQIDVTGNGPDGRPILRQNPGY